MRKPVIGVSGDYTSNDRVGVDTGLGMPGQDWQLLASDYVRAVTRAGGTPIILPITTDADMVDAYLALCDGLILTGGADVDPQFYGECVKYGLGAIEPTRDRHELDLTRKAIAESRIPILGICRGCQVLNVAAGGTLYQDIPTEFRGSLNHAMKQAPKEHPTHTVTIDNPSRLRSIFGEDDSEWVNSFHHQGIKDLGAGVHATMTAGDGMVEGIEFEGERFIVGIQWHPEMMLDQREGSLEPFAALIDAC